MTPEVTMTPHQQRFALATAFCLFVLIVELIRRRRLKPELAWLWLTTGIVILTLVFWYDALLFLTGLIGAVAPTSTLFLFGILFLLLICLQYSVRISQLEHRIQSLAQEIALLRSEDDP